MCWARPRWDPLRAEPANVHVGAPDVAGHREGCQYHALLKDNRPLILALLSQEVLEAVGRAATSICSSKPEATQTSAAQRDPTTSKWSSVKTRAPDPLGPKRSPLKFSTHGSRL